MALQVDQELRRDLLLKALDACPDLDQALEIAIRMERFILEGQTSDQTQSQPPRENGADERPPPQQVQEQEQEQEQGQVQEPKTGTRPRWTPDDDEQLRRLWREKLPVETIAERLNRTTASIYCRVRQLGLTANDRRKTKSGQKAKNGGGATQSPSADLA